jgi:hypothetical protein
MNPINIYHHNTTPPCQGGAGGGDHATQKIAHTGEKQESDKKRNKPQQLTHLICADSFILST